MTSFHARRLPHYHSIGQPTFLTWRLAGTLPKGRSFSHATAGESYLAMDRLLDNARIVEAILHRDPSAMNYTATSSWPTTFTS